MGGDVRPLSPAASRRLLAERDGGWGCVYCDASLTEANSTIDHVLPLSRGGLNRLDNMVLACHTCNSAKGSRTLEEWRIGVPKRRAVGRVSFIVEQDHVGAARALGRSRKRRIRKAGVSVPCKLDR